MTRKLLTELDDFLSVSECIPGLKGRPNTRKAVNRMLGWMEGVASYICRHMSTGYSGAMNVVIV